VYLPVLDAFIEELKRIDRKLGGGLAPRLVHYLLGKKDFYKVIADDGSRSTRIEAYNLSGTLGEPSLGVKGLYGRPKLKLPTRIIEIRHKDGSNNTVELTCDKGWQFSLRIHNASSEVEPSLKFDIQLVSKLSSHASVNLDEPWREIDEEMSNMILDDVAESLRYREYLPLYSLRAACGVLGAGETVDPEGWVKVEGIGKLDKTMVVVHAEGDSMEPTIHDGDLCVVRKVGGGNYDDQIILVQRNDKSSDPESGGAYLLKKLVKKGGKTLLRSINREYSDIVVERNNDIAVVAYLHKVMNG
jgi:phage repressor protein C with HTH and peptisase S24 domain